VITGIGSDITKISRIEALLMRNKQRFLNRIFTKTEIDLLKKISNSKRLLGYIAKRFAAKEAFAKALGTGIGKYASFQDIEIFSSSEGKPFFEFSAKLKEFLQVTYGAQQVHLSMTDEEDYAQAFVIIEKTLMEYN